MCIENRYLNGMLLNNNKDIFTLKLENDSLKIQILMQTKKMQIAEFSRNLKKMYISFAYTYINKKIFEITKTNSWALK